jgi:ferredoxin
LKNESGSCGICYAVCPVTTTINLAYNHRQQQQKQDHHDHDPDPHHHVDPHHHRVLLSQSLPVISTKIFLSFLAR